MASGIQSLPSCAPMASDITVARSSYTFSATKNAPTYNPSKIATFYIPRVLNDMIPTIEEGVTSTSPATAIDSIITQVSPTTLDTSTQPTVKRLCRLSPIHTPGTTKAVKGSDYITRKETKSQNRTGEDGDCSHASEDPLSGLSGCEVAGLVIGCIIMFVVLVYFGLRWLMYRALWKQVQELGQDLP